MSAGPRWRVDPGWTGSWELPDVLARVPSPEERDALAALAMSGLGPQRVASALAGCASVSEALERVPRAPDPQAARERLEGAGARAVAAGDDEYPPWLRAIAAPPLVLFVRGRRLDELVPGVAVVGSRVCTSGAARFATRLASCFAGAGLTVVSGLARGIDAAAHFGALDAGATMAVLGTGIDRVYPAEHRRLAERVVESGALVTEFAPGTTPRPWHFPARNRIISGLSMAVVVVEAGVRSGALITAGFALDQGREVFACTVAPESPSGAGVRDMLRDGARLVVHEEDAARDLIELARGQGLEASMPPAGEQRAAELRGEERDVWLSVLEDTTVDEIVARTALGPGRVSAVLASLELEGLVSDDGGGRWRRTPDIELAG